VWFGTWSKAMSWSWKIGRLFGIPLYMHWTFLILLGWVFYRDMARGMEASQALVSVGFILVLFACVVLHELGHALTARRFGIPTSDITLLPIGGVARLERMPEKPSQELLVAIAGPLVNVVIAGILYAVGVRPTVGSDMEDILQHRNFWGEVLVVNLFLVGFNLLPAFPMDGGRILRALLAMAMPYPKATRTAASVGQLMAILFGFGGLSTGNPFLVLIALFVWLGAEAEARQVEERFLIGNERVESAMLTEYHTIDADSTLGRAAELLLAGSQQDFPVTVDGTRTALLTRGALMKGLSEGGRERRVAEADLVEMEQVQVGTPLNEAIARLRSSGTGSLLVVSADGTRPAGLLTMENVGELLMLRAALGQGSDPTATATARRGAVV
jgi:Zn-dependent protease